MSKPITPYNMLDPVKEMKMFLEMVQPLPVKYGYIRGVAKDESYITYRNMSSNVRVGIGNTFISERVNYVVTIQTKTAEQNLMYSAMVKYGTYRSKVLYVSEDLRRDTTVKNGWINTIILSAYNKVDLHQEPIDKLKYTKAEVEQLLQGIADRYVMITSLFRTDIADSLIDKFVIPELEDRIYYYTEVIEMKREYLDRFVLAVTEF